MKEPKLQLLSFNVVASDIAFAVSVSHYCDPETGTPQTMVIRIAVDGNKIPTKVLDIPIYLPIKWNFQSYSHYELLDLFERKGNPFVPVRFENLELHKSQAGNIYGLAQSFSVEKNPLDYLEEEDIL